MDQTNRYKTPAKRNAYEHALELAGQTDDLVAASIADIASQLDHNLPREERHQIAAKALRVERGRRR